MERSWTGTTLFTRLCLVLDAGVYDSGELGNHSRGLDEVGGGDVDEVEGCLEGAWADGLNVGSVVECQRVGGGWFGLEAMWGRYSS